MKKIKKNDLIIYGCIAVFIISIIIIVLTVYKGTKHMNSIDSPLYSDKDVDMNCVLQQEDEYMKADWRIDGLFNHEGVGAKIYAKIVYSYKNVDTITDEIFCSYLEDLHGTDITLTEEDGCGYKGINTVEAGVSALGWDTIIERKDNEIIITYNEMYEESRDTTPEEQETLISEFKEQGFLCR